MSNTKVYRPDPDSVYTVRELMEILSHADPDALIIVGRHVNDCEDNINEIRIGRTVVGLFTDPDDISDDQ